MHAELNEWSRRLAALAEFEAPAAGWQGVLDARRQRDLRVSRRLPLAAAAAVLAIAAGLGWWLQSAQRDLERGFADEAGPVALASDSVLAENERLERLLASLPERQTMRGSTAFTVAELEDRLAALDDRLSRVTQEPNAPERAERLWRQRVGLMHSLVQVRYADSAGTY